MASTPSKTTDSAGHGKGYTPPKGRATASNRGGAASRRLSPNIEWILAGIVFVLVLLAIFYVGWGLNTPGGGGGGGTQSGAPAAVAELFAVGT